MPNTSSLGETSVHRIDREARRQNQPVDASSELVEQTDRLNLEEESHQTSSAGLKGKAVNEQEETINRESDATQLTKSSPVGIPPRSTLRRNRTLSAPASLSSESPKSRGCLEANDLKTSVKQLSQTTRELSEYASGRIWVSSPPATPETPSLSIWNDESEVSNVDGLETPLASQSFLSRTPDSTSPTRGDDFRCTKRKQDKGKARLNETKAGCSKTGEHLSPDEASEGTNTRAPSPVSSLPTAHATNDSLRTPESIRRSPSSRRASSTETSPSPSRRKISAYDQVFDNILLEKGIFQDSRIKPRNFDQLQIMLDQPRQKLRISKSRFDAFRVASSRITNEASTRSVFLPYFLEKCVIRCREEIMFWVEHLLPPTVRRCKPDYCDGADPKDLDRNVLRTFRNSIISSNGTTRTALANLFIEIKGPGGTEIVAQRQAAYGGAIGARGIHRLRSYIYSDAPNDCIAHTIAATYTIADGHGKLTLYAVYGCASQDRKDDVDYHMVQLRSLIVTDSLEAFRQGIHAMQNAREWADEQRKRLIRKANAKAKEQNS